MEVIKRHDDRVDAKTTVDLKEGLAPHMGRLDTFLAFLKKQKPEVYEAYPESLTEQVRVQLDGSLNLEALEITYVQEQIKGFDELHRAYLQFVLQLLGVKESHASDSIDTMWSDSLRAMLYPLFYRAKALCDLIGREPGIEFVKEFIDTRVYEVVQPDLEMEDLDGIWEGWQNQEESAPGSAIEFRISKGKIGGRVDKCMWDEVLRPFNDPELSYIVACYGDKAGMEARNPNLVFTRTTTLIKGGPYCDNCIHDKRHVEGIEHPSDAFFIDLEV